MKLIGDTHLGKRFINGVPLERRGEREEELYRQVIEELLIPEDTVLLGDLFDKAKVPVELVVRLIGDLKDVQHKIFILAGNHDLSKDKEKISSFILASYLNRNPNVVFITEPTPVESMLAVPYNPWGFDLSNIRGDYDCFLTHEDEKTLIENSKFISEHTGTVVNGHIHLRSEGSMIGNRVILNNVGSFQPFSHAEDSEGKIYVTLTAEEALERIDSLTDKCVRILLKPNEVFDEKINCRQISFKRVTEDGTESEEVKFDEFNMEELMREALKETKLFNRVWERYNNA